MRVSIRHREEEFGLSGAGRRYYVDCEVLFSEEEKAIVAARGLAGNVFTVDPPVPPPDAVEHLSAQALKPIGWTVLCFSPIIGIFNGGLGSLMIFAAIGMLVTAFALRRKVAIASIPQQVISLRRLLDVPRFTVYAPDPVRAQNADQAIRKHLTTLKSFLVGSIEIPKPETFEL